MARPSKDDKLIQDNPNLSAYELLKLGLSEKRYEELLKKENEAPKETKAQPSVTKSDKLIPEINQSARAMPKLTPHVPTQYGDQVRVITPDGKVVPFHPTYAQKLVRKNPNYKIV